MENNNQAFDRDTSEQVEVQASGGEEKASQEVATLADANVIEGTIVDAAAITELEPEEGVELIWVAAVDLVIGENVRTEFDLDKGFVADIKARGVREAITAHREDGRIIVHKGQQRALAAAAAGVKRVRVIIEPKPEGDEKKLAGDRIIDQLNENTLRSGLTDRDEIAATQLLLGLGFTSRQIATRRRIRRSVVDTQVALAQSEAARRALSDGADLVQASAIAEFEDDPEAKEQLEAVVRERPDEFDHRVQQLRDARTDRELLAAAMARLAEQGVRVIDEIDETGQELGWLRLSPSANYGSGLTPEEHRECPGHAVVLTVRRPASWQRDADPAVVETFVCTDWRANGHAHRWAPAGEVEQPRVGAPANGGKMTEEEKAERRKVIQNNRHWESATKERIRWITEVLLQRRNAPADAERWIANVLLLGGQYATRATSAEHVLTRRLLGLESDDVPSNNRGRIADALAKATASKAKLIAIAVLIAGHEELVTKDDWRHESPRLRAYLAQLESWGYKLSAIERTFAFPKSADDADDGAANAEHGGAQGTLEVEATDIEAGPDAGVGEGPVSEPPAADPEQA